MNTENCYGQLEPFLNDDTKEGLEKNEYFNFKDPSVTIRYICCYCKDGETNLIERFKKLGSLVNKYHKKYSIVGHLSNGKCTKVILSSGKVMILSYIAFPKDKESEINKEFRKNNNISKDD